MSSLLSLTRLCAPLHYVGKTARDVNARAAGSATISAEADAIPAVPAVTPDEGRGYAIGPATTTRGWGGPAIAAVTARSGACRSSSAEGYRTRATGVPGLPPFPPDMTTPKPPAPPVACAKAVRAAPHLHAKVALPVNATACSREWSKRLLLSAGRSLAVRREIGSLTCRFAPRNRCTDKYICEG